MNTLSLQNVVKTYGDYTAVDNVSFDVNKGTIFGLLGPNGAGKTSLIRIITTITGADSGQVLINGDKLNNFHPNLIGYMPEERGLYKKMKVGEQLLYLAQLKGLSYRDANEKIVTWMEKFEIQSWWNKQINELSKGMSQKVQFIATVVHNPTLIILDEPFTGLDPVNTNLIKDEIRELKNKGATIIFSTHRMEQVEQICENIALMNKGKIVLKGNVNQIKSDFKEYKFSIRFSGAIPTELNDENHNLEHSEAGEVIFKARDYDESNHILNAFIRNGAVIKSFNEILPSLNEIFIKQVTQ